MEKLDKKALTRFAWSVFGFHLLVIAIMFGGTIWEIFYPEDAWKILILAISIAIFQSLGQGWCPLTWLENTIWERCQPKRVYWDPVTLEASFIRYTLKKFLNIHAPEGTTTKLLILVLGITLIQTFSIPLIYPKVIVLFIAFYWFFGSKIWRSIAGRGPLNIIPTIVQWILIGISVLIATPVVRHKLKKIPEEKRYPLARLILLKIYLTLATGRGIQKVGEIAKGQHIYAANHGSHLDSSVFLKGMEKTFEDDPEKWMIIADDIMYKVPLFRDFLSVNGIRLDEKHLQKMVVNVIKAIKKGYSIFMFYEGERSTGPDNQLFPCKEGAGRIGQMTGLNIQLMLFFLPKRIAPKGWWNRPWFCMPTDPIKIIYGEVITTLGKNSEEINREIEEGLQKMLDEQLLLEKQKSTSWRWIWELVVLSFIIWFLFFTH